MAMTSFQITEIHKLLPQVFTHSKNYSHQQKNQLHAFTGNIPETHTSSFPLIIQTHVFLLTGRKRKKNKREPMKHIAFV